MHHNDTVKVKLTEDGLRILRSRYMLLKSYFPNTTIKFEDAYIIDSDNYWRTQLWNVVETLGYDESSHLTKPKFTSIEKIIEGHILQQFSGRIKDPEVLTHPQKYLGPRYKEVLDFWNKIENMSEEQLEVVSECYLTFCNENRSEWDKATDLSIDASREVVGENYASHAGWAAWDVSDYYAAYWATRELIGGIENPVFLPMFDNL